MGKNTGVVVAVLVVVFIGGWYLYSRSTPQGAQTGTVTNAGSYAYTCNNGSGFTMTPASDMSSITITGGAQDMLSGTFVLHASSTKSNTFEGTAVGAAVTFVGKGEGVTLTVGSDTATCSPVPDAQNAPWNWGDHQ